MNQQISFEEWQKLDLRVGEIKEVKKDFLKLTDGNNEFVIKGSFNIKKGDKIVFGLGNKIVLPILDGNVLLSPDDGAEPGMKIG